MKTSTHKGAKLSMKNESPRLLSTASMAPITLSCHSYPLCLECSGHVPPGDKYQFTAMVRAIEHQMDKENLLLHTHTRIYIISHISYILYIILHIYHLYFIYISSSATLFSPLPSIFPSIRVFSNDSALHIGLR